MKNRSNAVVIVSTGGISKVSDIPIFLWGMFTDKRIMPYNRFARFLLAILIISLRSPKTYGILKHSGPSPVLSYTRSIVKKLGNLVDADLFFAMRYTSPKIEELIDTLENYKKIFIVSLFPQFSCTTIASFMDRFGEVAKKAVKIDTFYKDARYIDIVAQKIDDALKKLPKDLRKKAVLLFSAHSLPISLVKKTGDPYIKQVKESAELLAKRFSEYRSELAFQSKLGPVKWFAPATLDKVAELSKRHLPIVVVPVSFIIDNSETIYEIDLLYKSLANKYGAAAFLRADCPNDEEKFVRLLAEKLKEKGL